MHPAPVHAADFLFNDLARLVERLAECDRQHDKKVRRLTKFLDTRIARRSGDDLFELFRLMLPRLDHERGFYGLKEKRLTQLLIGALDATKRKAAVAKDWPRIAHANHMKFPVVMQKVLFNEYCVPPPEDSLTLRKVNAGLDRLAAIAGEANSRADPADDRARLRALCSARASAQQREVLRGLLVQCTPAGAHLLTILFLKEELPFGLGAKAVLNAFHEDAFEAYASCSDMRLVLSELCQRGSTWKRTAVEPGLVVSPQLATQCRATEDAVRRMKGRSFVVETKFDGWRIQVHSTGRGPGSGLHYFSRRCKDHGVRSGFDVLDAALAHFLTPAPPAAAAAAAAEAAVTGGVGVAVAAAGAGGAVAAAVAGSAAVAARPTRVVLDGEMYVWNKRRKCAEPFGLLENAIGAASKDWDPQSIIRPRERDTRNGEEQYAPPAARDLEVVYVAFDILFLNDTSVVHLPLRERHRLLQGVFRPAGGEGSLPGGVPLGGKGAVTFRAEALVPGRTLFAPVRTSRLQPPLPSAPCPATAFPTAPTASQ
ncbi:DNA ligase 4 [Tetrabaena socialis]|uniref:DNA ligase 4 n=1 Tax=Tetrabaena socialis TaxID=47790 RepID=A0A2J8A8Q9_9CHLO|nr:DNA ligase 4 [Tetrabaena socialis]|eukprot:PNH08890.1 DNA ligase 4 [Tetrabaena socialis]